MQTKKKKKIQRGRPGNKAKAPQEGQWTWMDRPTYPMVQWDMNQMGQWVPMDRQPFPWYSGILYDFSGNLDIPHKEFVAVCIVTSAQHE